MTTNVEEVTESRPAQQPVGCTLADPADVLNHPTMTAAAKRELLASWASDARALEDKPLLRQLPNGAVVPVKAILRALELLDQSEGRLPATTEPHFEWRAPFSRRRSLGTASIGRSAARAPENDDDDPSPCAPALWPAPIIIR